MHPPRVSPVALLWLDRQRGAVWLACARASRGPTFASLWSQASGARLCQPEMLSKNVETLKNLNGTTAKFAKWYVRIIDPKIIRYTFMAKGEAIKAQKFQCVLVSKEPEQYMLGLVPFDFKDRHAAVAAAQRFTRDSASCSLRVLGVYALVEPGSASSAPGPHAPARLC